MNSSRKIQCIALIVKDLDAMKNFYVEKVGFRLVKEVAKDGFVQLQVGNQLLELYEFSKVSGMLGEDNLSSDFGKAKAIFSFNKSENMDEEYNILKSRGVEFVKEPTDYPWGERTAYFKDPEGNIWEIQRWIK